MLYVEQDLEKNNVKNDDLPTGIKEIEANEDDLPVYTLDGIRIADTRNLPKGVYIRNGKKFLVK